MGGNYTKWVNYGIIYKPFHFHSGNPNVKQEGRCEDFALMFAYLPKLLMERCVCFSVTILRSRNKASLPPKEKKKKKKRNPYYLKNLFLSPATGDSMVTFALWWILSAEMRRKFQFKSSLKNAPQWSFHVNYVIVAHMQFLWHENDDSVIHTNKSQRLPVNNSIFWIVVHQLWPHFFLQLLSSF